MTTKKTKTAVRRRKAANTALTDARLVTMTRMRGSVRQELDEVAAAEGRTRSNLIEKFIVDGLARMREGA